MDRLKDEEVVLSMRNSYFALKMGEIVINDGQYFEE